MEGENQSVVVESSSDISTEQMDKFFEEAAQEENSSSSPIQESTAQSDEPALDNSSNVEEETAAQADEKHMRNYKAAMHEERNRRKMIEQELQNQRNVIAKMNNTFDQFVKAAQQEQMEKMQQQMPRYEEDPLEYTRKSIEELQDYTLKQRQYIENQQRAHQQAAQRAAIEERFIGDYKNSATQFAETQPDFKEAYQFITNKRIQELEAAGWERQQAVRLMQEDEASIVAKAFRDGVNPAQRIYNLAKVNGFAARSQQGSSALDKIDEKIGNLERGMRMNRSLNSMGGSSDSSAKLTLERLAQMDGDDFSKNWDKVIKGHSQFNK